MRTLKELKSRGLGPDNPLSFPDRLKWDWDNFQEANPEFIVDLKIERTPFQVTITNTLTGEIRTLIAKSYDGVFNIKYGWLGQTWDSSNIFSKVLEVMGYGDN